jgi:hypothetical protein
MARSLALSALAAVTVALAAADDRAHIVAFKVSPCGRPWRFCVELGWGACARLAVPLTELPVTHTLRRARRAWHTPFGCRDSPLSDDRGAVWSTWGGGGGGGG